MTIACSQRTLAGEARCQGVGIHSGRKVHLAIKPAPVNHGIKFCRVDLPDRPLISAHFSKVVDTSLATVIGVNGFIVSTVEHLMASFAGLGIDNALVEIDAYEMPIMDGSAGPFTRILRQAGICEQDKPKHFFVVKQPIRLEENEKSVHLLPAAGFSISCTIDYDHPLIGCQQFVVDFSDGQFEREIAPARTFGFYNEYEGLKRYGLARGGSLDNVVVIDREGVLNPGGLRFPDEFVRHKILDCIGDFSLLGMPIQGRLLVKRSGHAFNHAFLQKFFTEKSAWETLPCYTCLPSNGHRSKNPVFSDQRTF
jgi:UDP-3-O-[3-hydroxymyristoyl] N-acetylglucosamine deacetylase